MDGRRRRSRAPVTESGVQADSSVALLVMVLLVAVELLFRTSVLVDVGQCWWTFDGPATAQTAQRRPRNDLDRRAGRTRSAGSGIPSRKLRSAGPRPAGPGGAPHRTYDLDQPGAVWLPPVRDGSRCSAGHPGVARVQGRSPGRRRPCPGRRAGGPARRRQTCAPAGPAKVGPPPRRALTTASVSRSLPFVATYQAQRGLGGAGRSQPARHRRSAWPSGRGRSASSPTSCRSAGRRCPST